MSKLSNTILMLTYLQNGRKYSIKELAARLDVKPRMVRIYKDDLEKAGFIIDTIYGPYGGYILRKNTLSLSQSFNEYDLNMLNKLILENKNEKEYLNSLIDKIKTIINSNSNFNTISKYQKTYNILSRAIKERRKVKIEYNSYNKGLNTRIIYPLELFYLKDNFAVASFCETKKDLRHFELNRITKITLLDENY